MGALPPDLHRGSAPGPHWGTFVPPPDSLKPGPQPQKFSNTFLTGEITAGYTAG